MDFILLNTFTTKFQIELNAPLNNPVEVDKEENKFLKIPTKETVIGLIFSYRDFIKFHIFSKEIFKALPKSNTKLNKPVNKVLIIFSTLEIKSMKVLAPNILFIKVHISPTITIIPDNIFFIELAILLAITCIRFARLIIIVCTLPILLSSKLYNFLVISTIKLIKFLAISKSVFNNFDKLSNKVENIVEIIVAAPLNTLAIFSELNILAKIVNASLTISNNLENIV